MLPGRLMAVEKDLKPSQVSSNIRTTRRSSADPDQMRQVQARMAGIQHKLVVMSGKGGVGKSDDDRQSGSRLCARARSRPVDVDLNGRASPHAGNDRQSRR